MFFVAEKAEKEHRNMLSSYPACHVIRRYVYNCCSTHPPAAISLMDIAWKYSLANSNKSQTYFHQYRMCNKLLIQII